MVKLCLRLNQLDPDLEMSEIERKKLSLIEGALKNCHFQTCTYSPSALGQLNLLYVLTETNEGSAHTLRPIV